MGIFFYIIGWLMFGLIVGAIARFLLPGRQQMSWLMTILLGVAGSFLGGALGSFVFGRINESLQPGGWLTSIVGAFLLVFVYSRLKAPQGE
jgi:uncharacterized membrane protein YeaQ/YmgE (transglycosylase-associated protein family)